LLVSGAVATGFIFFGAESSSSPQIFVTPAIVQDDTKQVGAVFSVDVNVTEAPDLFAWQINMSWNPAILSVNNIVAGEFLLRTSSPNKTASFELGHVINVTEDVQGYTCMSESILGDVAGISGNGTLVSIEFLVVGYGSTDLNLSLSETLPTLLLDSTMASITIEVEDGSFSNLLPGDIGGDTGGTPPDGDVDRYDFGYFADAYGSSVGDSNYNSLADLQGDTAGSPPDGDVDRYDFGAFADNYGRSI
jgi:hypothetical protein